jgi:hypothetical protein
MRTRLAITKSTRTILAVAACSAASAALVSAQGREWTTSAFDAQRTAWVRTDVRINKSAVEKGEFKFLWKAPFDNEARQLGSLTQPVLQDWLIGYRGFKSLAFVGGSADRIFAIDTDLAKPYWTTHLTYAAATGGQPPSSWECPGGLVAAPSRRTPLAPSGFGGGFGGGGRTPAKSAVGEPGKGAAVLAERAARAAGGPPPGPRNDAPPPTARQRALGAIPFGGVDPLYVVGSDGLLRTLRVSDGAEMSPALPFLPPNTRPSALIYVDGVVYTTTSNGCGATPNAVWAIDLGDEQKKVSTWKTGGASVAGASGVAFGTDGTVYVAIGAGSSSASAPSTNGHGGAQSYANAIVALDRSTLTPKDWFTADGADFNTSPMVIRYKDKDLVAAAGNDGKLYLLDSASLGGADHKTPLQVTAKYSAAGAGGALATWEDESGRWILAPVVGAPQAGVKFTPAAAAAAGAAAPAAGSGARGSIVAFKLADAGGKPALEPGWQSRNLVSPLAPIVVNGMVFTVSSGEYRPPEGAAAAAPTLAQRAQRSTPAVLYVLDGATGKELWSSGKSITSFARAGLSAGGGQVYLVTHDNHLYAFGIPIEH